MVIQKCDDFFLNNGCDDDKNVDDVKEETFSSVLIAPAHASAIVSPLVGVSAGNTGVINSYHVDTWAIYEITNEKIVKVLVENIVMVKKKMTNDEEVVEYHFVLRDRHGFLYNVKSTENRMMIYFPCLDSMCS